MHQYNVFAGAIGLFSLLHLLRWLTRPLLSPLRSIPGPFFARWTDAWYFWRVSKGHFEADNLALHRHYGTIVRYGPNRYSISDPGASSTIYDLGSRFAKSSWYSTWANPDAWSIFADQSIERHARNRRQFQSTYSMTALVDYEPYVDQCGDLIAQRLTQMADAGRQLDMGHWFQCYAFDVIGLITYGKRLGFLDHGDDVGGIIGALEDHLSYATLMGIYSRFHRFTFALRNLLAGKKGAGRAYILSFTKNRITEQQATGEKLTGNIEGKVMAKPFLEKFMTKNGQDPKIFTMEHVLVGCAMNMVAGSDTTAISLSAILYYLLKHQQCLRRLRDEISEFQEQGKLSNSFKFKETQQMPYLQAVIKEALRIHPATGLPLERVVPKGGATISGRFFPGDTIVGINSWVIHRDPQIFGRDADLFNPERWLTGDKARIALMNRHWMPFGLGSRVCIGRHVSMLEMTKLVPRIVRDFDFELPQRQVLEDHHWSTQNLWFVKPRGFELRVARHRSE
ncbi:cytochrome P450 [Xylariaceae sp. AK1471]|nr:cytochrome P450 [Xylariaceae sp. AK1471]